MEGENVSGPVDGGADDGDENGGLPSGGDAGDGGPDNGEDADGDGPIPSNEDQPINDPDEVPPSNDLETEGQADILGVGNEGPDIEIVVQTPGFTLELDGGLDSLGGTNAPPPTPAKTTGPVPSNDDP